MRPPRPNDTADATGGTGSPVDSCAVRPFATVVAVVVNAR